MIVLSLLSVRVLSFSPEDMYGGEENSGNFSTSRTKHDWYQTATHVTITILIRNLNANDVQVDFTDTTLDCVCKFPDGNEYKLHLNLFKPIIVSQSSWKLSVSKLEIKLKKFDSSRWSNLEAVPQVIKSKGRKAVLVTPTVVATNENSGGTDGAEVENVANISEDAKNEAAEGAGINLDANVETSNNLNDANKCAKSKDWDKIVREFEEEEKSNKGEGSVDELFREIYEKGGEEVRRAMNKSFTESAGTVLSTNWAEVSKGKTDVKPPDGCEVKKWDS